MKRLFVAEGVHHTGIGRRLCIALINEAKADGFSLMRLDTANRLHEAQALYRSLGFVECAPYNDYPARLMSFIVFMELALKGRAEQAKAQALQRSASTTTVKAGEG